MSPEQVQVWEKLQVMTERLHREVGRDSWNDAQLSDAEFTIPAHLRSAGPLGVRASECARTIGWDTSRLSHLVRRLEGRGLLTRSAGDGFDGRASILTSSGEGHSAYRRAIGPHLQSAHTWFAQALDEQQLHAFTRALDALLEHTTRLAQARTPTAPNPGRTQKGRS